MLKVNVMHGLMRIKRTQKMPIHKPRHRIHKCLQHTCLVDGSWTSESQYSGYGWVWIDVSENEHLLGQRNKERHLSPLHS